MSSNISNHYEQYCALKRQIRLTSEIAAMLSFVVPVEPITPLVNDLPDNNDINTVASIMPILHTSAD